MFCAFDIFRMFVQKACAVFAALLFGVLVCFALPGRAYALYTQASSEYPATQDLQAVAEAGLAAEGRTIYGALVSGSELRDGTYVVPAYTSSRMCNFYATQADATAKSNANHATIMVSGGNITAMFYLSGAYTAVYFGSAEQAAAIAPADGVTPSGDYLTDGSNSYDTGHGPFYVSVPSLNGIFSLATYNGGSRGDQGMWYTRMGSFVCTDDLYLSAGTGSESGSDEPQEQEKPDKPDNPGTPGQPDQPGNQSESSEPQKPTQPDSPQQSEEQNVAGDPEDEAPQNDFETLDEQFEEEEEVGGEEPLQAAPAAKRGVLVSFVSADSDDGAGVLAIKDEGLLTLGGLSPAQIMGIVFAALALGGAAFAVVRFRLGMRAPKEGTKGNR